MFLVFKNTSYSFLDCNEIVGSINKNKELFIIGWGEKMVLEALDKIREAEESIKKMRQTAEKEISTYEQNKAIEFKKKQEDSQDKVNGLLQKLETQKNEQLQREKDVLLSEAKEQDQEFKEKYEKNHESLIDYVIERVKKIYGGQ